MGHETVNIKLLVDYLLDNKINAKCLIMNKKTYAVQIGLDVESIESVLRLGKGYRLHNIPVEFDWTLQSGKVIVKYWLA